MQRPSISLPPLTPPVRDALCEEFYDPPGRAALLATATTSLRHRTMAMGLEGIERVYPWLGPGANMEISYN
jgi:hypothetical protein